ncbi:MAG: hypothetical protein CUN51_06070 [Candidatus Thermofonsia Clade 1 bacterium]|uniref:Uncharacterized protein n=1 Tax=Candidatus Thermofonsia Clade 1 bacterium TaxID=2364210 RepID=A0A2M8P0H2_9CHLR|nr:MAG: hypothetical protein CUN51_06070 [Candidatus Thermofonsia Clade 1 bacterium]
MSYTLGLALSVAHCALAYQERGGAPQPLFLPDLSAPDGCIPTALYVAPDGTLHAGQAALPFAGDRRFFERIPALLWAQPEPAPRLLDGTAWDVRKVGAAFTSAIFTALPFPLTQLERVMVSAPPFESAHIATRYVRWLHEALTALGIPETRLYLMSELDAAALSGGVWSAEAPVFFVQADSPDSFLATFAYLSASKSLSTRLDHVLCEGVPFASLMTQRVTAQSLQDALADCLAYAAEQALYPSDLIYLALTDSADLSVPVPAEQAWAARGALAAGVRALAEGLLRTPPYLQNSYGLRYQAADGAYAYIELAPSGTPFPSALRTVRLAAAYDDQPMLEFVIGMFDPEAKGQITLNAADSRLSYTLEPSELGAIALNEFAPPLRITLPQPVRAAEPCLEATFRLDAQRQLRLTATDMRTGALLADDTVITTLY